MCVWTHTHYYDKQWRFFGCRDYHAITGSLDKFDEQQFVWGEYCERFQQYFLTNKINNTNTKMAVLLSSVGAETSSTLCLLCVPKMPNNFSTEQFLANCKH